jgi:chemotaxis protein methyltransferase CheR
MDDSLFQRFSALAYQKAGIHLKPGKEALVSARVGKRLRALDLASESEYVTYLEQEESGEELVQFLDVISTNFTSFFREPDHFDVLREVVERRLAAGQTQLRLWSAASSSGEEPYSIAIALRDQLENKGGDFRILATDISTRVLAQARDGVYPGARLAPLSKAQLTRHFRRLRDHADPELERYEVLDQLKERITFARLNLSAPPFPMKGPLDMVFCRNVLIYFDRRVRQGLISEIERLLRPGGTLVIGHTETLTGIQSRFRMLRPSVFALPEAA